MHSQVALNGHSMDLGSIVCCCFFLSIFSRSVQEAFYQNEHFSSPSADNFETEGRKIVEHPMRGNIVSNM